MRIKSSLCYLKNVIIGGMVLLLAVCFTGIFSVESHGAALTANFSKFVDAPSSNLTVDKAKYYAVQGTAYDTYTGKDGYTFAISKLASKKESVKLVHYTQGGSAIRQVKSVIYTKAQVGHANDATVYKKGSSKYIFVARGGKGNKTAAMIKLTDFNKGTAKVYPVQFNNLDSKSGTDLRGISYAGQKTVTIGKNKVKKDIFVVEVGRRVNMVYLKTLDSKKAVFVKLDSQRFSVPKIGSRECTAQGITYHRGNLYVTWGDEGKGGKNKTGKITCISYSTLFKGNKPDTAKSFTSTWTQTRKYEFTPEALYFTKLEGKLPMFLSCNYGLKDGRDEITKSKQVF